MVLRASTDNTLDDLERAVDDGVNAYKVPDFAWSFFAVTCCIPVSLCSYRVVLVALPLKLDDMHDIDACQQAILAGHYSKGNSNVILVVISMNSPEFLHDFVRHTTVVRCVNGFGC